MKRRGASTYAAEAIKEELAHRKQVRSKLDRQQRDEAEARKRELARQKAKAKHRGR